jgi:hypothetical protein
MKAEFLAAPLALASLEVVAGQFNLFTTEKRFPLLIEQGDI